MGKVGYLNFSAVSSTLFTIMDGDQQTDYEFNQLEPQACIETIATLIQQHGLEEVVCNKMGYGLGASISHQLKTKYGNFNCTFKMN